MPSFSFKCNCFISVFILSLVAFPIRAQQFSKLIEHSATVNTNESVIVAQNAAYHLMMTQVDLSNDFRKSIELVTTDNNGNVVESNTLEALDAGYSMVGNEMLCFDDGTKLIAGNYGPKNSFPSHPSLIMLDVNSNILWSKYIDLAANGSITLNLLQDSTILYTFKYNDGLIHHIFCKIDFSGNLTSFKEFNGPISPIVRVLPEQGSFTLINTVGNLVNIENDLSQVNWERKYYTEIGINFNRTANGDYIISSAQTSFPGYMTVFRTDENGNLIWAKYVEAWQEGPQGQISIFDIVGIHFVKEDSSGNIIASANSEGGLNGFYNLMLDANGNYLGNTKVHNFKNKTELIDDNYFLIASFSNNQSINDSDVQFEKRNYLDVFPCDSVLSYSMVNGTDSLITNDGISLVGNITAPTENIFSVSVQSLVKNISNNCDISALSTNEKMIDKPFNLYPNPTHSYLTVDINEPILELELYSLSGQLIKTYYTKTVNLSEVEKGIYIMKIKLTNSTLTKRVVKN